MSDQSKDTKVATKPIKNEDEDNEKEEKIQALDESDIAVLTTYVCV